MANTDPIADLLTRVRNAQMAQHKQVSAPFSKVKAEVARVLKEEGYITDYSVVEGSPYNHLVIRLKYHDEAPVITGIKRESTPGQRRYFGASDLPEVLNGLGIAIMSTSHGVMTGRKAKEARVGGEYLCSVW